jgi:ribonuclease G
MSEEILINFTPQETRVAVMHQGVVQELHIERSASRGSSATSTSGGSSASCPGMQSAFIDIGLGRTAFPACGRHPRSRVNGDEPLRPIERLLFEGQSILVQVIKDPMGSKGARLSTQVSIAGRMLVYLPQDKHIGISQRIEREAEREALREKLTRAWYPATSRAASSSARWPRARPKPNWPRTSSTCARSGATSGRSRRTAAPPALLYQELSSRSACCVTSSTPKPRIVIDSRENFQRLTSFAAEYTPTVRALLEHYIGERPLFDLHGVEDEIQKALARRVDLKSGGYLIIDQTEAMTTIDVNTGGFVGVRNFDDTIFKTNLEAAQTIARQLRLRNLGGIIIIDFIDMENAEHRDAVLSEFNKALARDHTA